MYFHHDITDFKPYRSAQVLTDMAIELNETQIKFLKLQLKQWEFKMDNHICFRSGPLWFQYSDHYLYIGTELKEGRW